MRVLDVTITCTHQRYCQVVIPHARQYPGHVLNHNHRSFISTVIAITNTIPIDLSTSHTYAKPSTHHTYTHHHNNLQAQSASDQSRCRTTPYPRSCCTPAKYVPDHSSAHRKTVRPTSTRSLKSLVSPSSGDMADGKGCGIPSME